MWRSNKKYCKDEIHWNTFNWEVSSRASDWLQPASQSMLVELQVVPGGEKKRKRSRNQSSENRWHTHAGVLLGSVRERRMTNHARASGGALTAYVRAGASVATFGHFISVANQAAQRCTGLHLTRISERQGEEAECYTTLLPTHHQHHSKKKVIISTSDADRQH